MQRALKITNCPFKHHTSYSSSRVPRAVFSSTVHSTRGFFFYFRHQAKPSAVKMLKIGTWQLQHALSELGYLAGHVFFAANLSVSRRSRSLAPSSCRSQLTCDSLKNHKVCRIPTIPRMLAPPCLTQPSISSHQFHTQLPQLRRSIYIHTTRFLLEPSHVRGLL